MGKCDRLWIGQLLDVCDRYGSLYLYRRIRYRTPIASISPARKTAGQTIKKVSIVIFSSLIFTNILIIKSKSYKINRFIKIYKKKYSYGQCLKGEKLIKLWYDRKRGGYCRNVTSNLWCIYHNKFLRREFIIMWFCTFLNDHFCTFLY